MSIARILLLDTPSFTSRRLEHCLSGAGYEVLGLEREEALIQALRSGQSDVLLVAADRAGADLARALKDLGTPPDLILLDDLGSLERCEPGLRALAQDSITRPASDAHLLEAVRSGLARRALSLENSRLRAEPDGFSGVLSVDPRMQRIFATISAVADSRATVLIHGESGTGKTILARTVHLRSSDPQAPFIVVNCGALPGSLLGSELFGHVKGAFTGAVKDRAGKFEAAHGGTIFLDEIGTASADLQVKLLRVIEEGTFERVGESKSRTVDVRVIAATNVDLKREVELGNFRSDLYYRLHVVPIAVPPLRERPGDITLLAEHFVARFAARHGRPIRGLQPQALQQLRAHAWPGNVRELENTLERAVLLAQGEELGPGDLWPADQRPPGTEDRGVPRLEDLPLGPLREVLEVPERWLVERALTVADGSRKEAALILGINRTTLFNKMRKYGLFCDGEDGPDHLGPETLGRTG